MHFTPAWLLPSVLVIFHSTKAIYSMSREIPKDKISSHGIQEYCFISFEYSTLKLSMQVVMVIRKNKNKAVAERRAPGDHRGNLCTTKQRSADAVRRSTRAGRRFMVLNRLGDYENDSVG